MLLTGGADPIFVDDDGYRADEHAKGHEGVLSAFSSYGFSGPSAWLTKKWFLESFGCWTPPAARRHKVVQPVRFEEHTLKPPDEGREQTMDKGRRKKETDMDRRRREARR